MHGRHQTRTCSDSSCACSGALSSSLRRAGMTRASTCAHMRNVTVKYGSGILVLLASTILYIAGPQTVAWLCGTYLLQPLAQGLDLPVREHVLLQRPFCVTACVLPLLHPGCLQPCDVCNLLGLSLDVLVCLLRPARCRGSCAWWCIAPGA